MESDRQVLERRGGREGRGREEEEEAMQAESRDWRWLGWTEHWRAVRRAAKQA